ncbi:hypothetical protein [Xanthomonas phage DES1]|nr:hypothetical protein [Xanthomonas phage DES1]
MNNPLFEKARSIVGYFKSGSSFVCDPPVQDTDEDYVIFTFNLANLRLELESLGYTYSNKDIEKYKLGKTDPFAMYNSFDSYRHPDNRHNLICVSNELDFTRWKVATLLAKQLNVLDKHNRISLFRAIRSGGTLYEGPKHE